MVVSLYRKRFQIEENFRDTKNGKRGIGLAYANSKSVERFDNLLLVLWCIGQPLIVGQSLAQILRMDNYGDGEPLHQITLDHDVLPILHFSSASVNQCTELYKVFTEYFTL